MDKIEEFEKAVDKELFEQVDLDSMLKYFDTLDIALKKTKTEKMKPEDALKHISQVMERA